MSDTSRLEIRSTPSLAHKFCLRRRRYSGCSSEPIAVTAPAMLGRSPFADIHVPDPWVSRVHCELVAANGQLFIKDLESRHGVYVNGERVSHKMLAEGDLLQIGISDFIVERVDS